MSGENIHSSDRGFKPRFQIVRFVDTAVPQVKFETETETETEKDMKQRPKRHDKISDFLTLLGQYANENRKEAVEKGVCPQEKKCRDGLSKEERERNRKAAIVRYQQRKEEADRQADQKAGHEAGQEAGSVSTGKTASYGDPYCTLFLAHLPRKVTAQDVSQVCSKYGAVVQTSVVQRGGKRPYAFVVYGERSEARRALAGLHRGSFPFSGETTRIVADVERGRVVKNWVPARLRR